MGIRTSIENKVVELKASAASHSRDVNEQQRFGGQVTVRRFLVEAQEQHRLFYIV